MSFSTCVRHTLTPLHCMRETLVRRAKKINKSAIVAHRRKRLVSIKLKLDDNPNMALSKMNDVGGCRAVLRSVRQVKRLVKVYARSNAKSPNQRVEFVKPYDYVASPKPDGYRSVHLVYKYRSNSKHGSKYNGLRIEIQIRTEMQHAWATAVETVSIFTGSRLRAESGHAGWKRFFALVASVMAAIEKCPGVPGTPPDFLDLIIEIKQLYQSLGVENALSGWSAAVQMLETDTRPADSYLLILNANDFSIAVKSFTAKERKRAEREYRNKEKEIGNSPNMQTVLVSVESVKELRQAYPNYFLDTRRFLMLVKQMVE